MLRLISVIPWPLIGRAVSDRLKVHRKSDWVPILCSNSSGASLCIINFWSRSTQLQLALDSDFLNSFPVFVEKLWSTNSFPATLAWFNFGHAPPNFYIFLASAWWRNFVYLEKNCWSELAQIWCANPLWESPGLINFWTCSTIFPPFPGIGLGEQFL